MDLDVVLARIVLVARVTEPVSAVEREHAADARASTERDPSIAHAVEIPTTSAMRRKNFRNNRLVTYEPRTCTRRRGRYEYAAASPDRVLFSLVDGEYTRQQYVE